MNPPQSEIFFTTVSGRAAEPLPLPGLDAVESRVRSAALQCRAAPFVVPPSGGKPRFESTTLQPPQGGTTNPPTGRRDSHCRISVVFSFWNEEAVLPELIRRLRAVFDVLVAQQEIADYELIFVNDASTDRSEQLLRDEARRRGDIRVVNMSRNFGVSPCVMAGLLHARGDAVIYMDADLQDPPEVIPDLVHKWKSDPQVEVVHTVRHARLGESRIKRFITRIGYLTLRAVSSIDLPYEAGDFKLLSRRAVDQVVQFREKKPFMRGLVSSLGFKQEIVYYERQPRAFGSTKFPVLGIKVIRNFLDSALISFSEAPLKAATVLGVLFGGAGLCAMVALLAAWLQSGSAPGWLAAMASVLLVGGAQLVCLGFLGSYVGAIYLETKGRPNFIIKELIGFEDDQPVPMAQRQAVINGR